MKRVLLLTLIALLAPQVAQAKVSSSFFGVMPQTSLTERDFQQMAQGGIGHLRMWIPWQIVEPASGSYQFSSLDAQVSLASKYNIRVLPYVFGTPSWVSAADGCAGSACVIHAPSSAYTRAAFARFMETLARRYGPGGALPAWGVKPITHWQIWNEQNSPTFMKPQSVSAYAELLRSADEGLRRADPASQVITGGVWGPKGGKITPAVKYLTKLYKLRGIKRIIDGIGVHPYSSSASGSVSQVQAARQVAVRMKDRSASVWVTEIGWASHGPKNYLVKGSDRAQAKILSQTYKKLIAKRGAWKIKGVFWYAWQDTSQQSAVCSWCAGSGLLNEAGGMKPAWSALSSLTRR